MPAPSLAVSSNACKTLSLYLNAAVTKEVINPKSIENAFPTGPSTVANPPTAPMPSFTLDEYLDIPGVLSTTATANPFNAPSP